MDEKTMLTVTSPLLPSLDDLIPLLQDIWSRKSITNNGYYHVELERALADYLKVPYISLFTNGTLPILCALKALQISGEVITTPYSFVATTHSLSWSGIKPVFVDILPDSCNMDPSKIEEAITPRTTAIMPVHVYGMPCDTEVIQAIADKHGLKVIYDAAHAFGVEINGESILTKGNLSTLSFHATKVYNTIEGGAIISPDAETKLHIDYLRNFGFEDEIEVVLPGINGKMDEIRAAYGLLNLKQVNEAIDLRRRITNKYRDSLKNVVGITYLNDREEVRHNYAYFPIFVDAALFGMTRDELYFKLKAHGVYARRYFYPLISDFPTYQELESSKNLPIAKEVAQRVICLPLFGTITEEEVNRVLQIIAVE
ncbi:MAG: DegT/DnrJ/EryC1/StrS family aminotransferase [Phocaeicola sp.]